MQIEQSTVIPAPPDAVWAVTGDAAAIADWVPALEKSHVVDDMRYVTFAGGGGDATERILARDEAGRTITYEYLTGPLPLEQYRATIAVQEHPDGAKVVWSAEFSAGSDEEEKALHTAIGEIYQAALAELSAQVLAADG